MRGRALNGFKQNIVTEENSKKRNSWGANQIKEDKFA